MGKPVKVKHTLYMVGGFGAVKYEVTDLKLTYEAYAQYAKAVVAVFVPKGKRNPRRITQTDPSLVVLEGWGHPDPPAMWEAAGPECAVSRYSCFDERWQKDFDAVLKAYLETSGLTLAYDFRGHKSGSRVGFDTWSETILDNSPGV